MEDSMRAIGSSCVPKICEVHHLGGPWDVYEERVEGRGLQPSEFIQIGEDAEQLIAKLGMRKMAEKGYHFHLRPGTKKGDGTTLTRFREFHGVGFRDTPDFTLSESKGHRKVLMVGEIKLVRNSADKDLYGEDWSQELPEGYLVQCQFHCFIYQVDVCVVFVSFGFWGPPKIYLVKADDAKIAAMVERSAAWWKAHVEKRVPPSIDATDACSVYLKHLALHDEALRECTQEEFARAVAMGQRRQLMKQLEKEDKADANFFREQIGGHRGIRLGDRSNITCSTNKHGTRTLRLSLKELL
tara:strand:+ start:4073 stop:4966 length:894 start_codon:yes stop_codon:yes gene_type:complete